MRRAQRLHGCEASHDVEWYCNHEVSIEQRRELAERQELSKLTTHVVVPTRHRLITVPSPHSYQFRRTRHRQMTVPNERPILTSVIHSLMLRDQTYRTTRSASRRSSQFLPPSLKVPLRASWASSRVLRSVEYGRSECGASVPHVHARPCEVLSIAERAEHREDAP